MRTRHLMIGTAFLLGALISAPAVLAADSGEADTAFAVEANARFDSATPLPAPEQEVKLWILNAGYDQVSGLEIVGPGIYQGTALCNGDTYDVVVDAAGNVLGVKE